jgi:Zn-dependent peptidase ImmA (M78 family)
MVPQPETIQALADATSFQGKFFYSPVLHQIASDAASFRALRRMTVRQRDVALAAGEMAFDLDDWIDARFERPNLDVPDLRGIDPETAAMITRTQWSLGVRPVPTLLHLLEKHGVRVYSLAIPDREVDAFSVWREGTPFIFLNTTKSAERSRFDAAHELGHLVLHRHGAVMGRSAEEDADQFAAAFLMPRAQLLASPPRNVTIATLIPGKLEWGVSTLAYAHRLRELELLSEWHFRQLCIRLRSQHGDTEPAERQRETSQALSKVFADLRSDNFSARRIADELGWSSKDLEDLVFGLVMLSVSGEGGASEAVGPRPDLRLMQ